jgi:membrane protein implicated in regulation of membrane protease activity
VILAATNPDTAALSWAYVASVAGFFASLAIFCAVSVWLLDRAASRRLRRHVSRALNRGDSNVLRAVEAAEQIRRHHSVPRRLEGTRR